MTLLILSLMTFLAFSYYTSDLKAALTTTRTLVSFYSFEDALAKGHRVIVVKDSSYETLLRTAAPGSAANTLYRERILADPESGFVSSYAEELDVMATGGGPGAGKLLAFTDVSRYPSASAAISDTNKAVADMGSVYETTNSIVLQRGSEFTQIFNYYLRRMKEKGILKRS